LEALHPVMITQMQRNLTFHKPILAVASGSQGIGGSGTIDGAGGDKAAREREHSIINICNSSSNICCCSNTVN